MLHLPLSWLQDYVTLQHTSEGVSRLLTNAGLEVKTTDFIGLPGADLVWDRDKIVLSQLLEVTRHPNADKLLLATVEYGATKPKTVVTGAPNLWPYLDQEDLRAQELYSPLALEGAELNDPYNPGKKMTLKGRPLRGIYNDAMLCSEKELGLSEEHEGIILMRRDAWSSAYRAGTPLQDVLGDAVLNIDIIPNIARCISIVGVAREYAALTNQPLRYPEDALVMEGAPITGRVHITTEEPRLNPRFIGLLIEGVEQKPSPYWMQHRLRLAGQRPINVVVDISNYVMLELGQPNHTFDYDFLRRRADSYAPDGPVHIHTRLPRPGETLTTLDGVQHSLNETNILVTDPLGNLSLGGVMGGLDSEIKPETRNVLLEAAAWDFITIRRSGTSLDIYSEAYFRFSRGVHPSQALPGARRAAEWLRRLAGGVVAQGMVDNYPAPPPQVTVRLDLDYARRLSGLDLTPAEIADLLRRLEFNVVEEAAAGALHVTVPDHRLDIEGPHDLVEELCRVYGYDRIPATILSDSLPPQRGNPSLEQEERIKNILIQQGLQEVITHRLTAPEAEAQLWPEPPAATPPYVTLTNPNAVERRVMRRRLLASLLEVATSNSRFQPRIAVFEIGPVFWPTPEAVLPAEHTYLALLMTGARDVASWQQAETGRLDFFDLKGVLEALSAHLATPWRYEAATHPSYRPGRTARLCLGEAEIGWMGELHPVIVERLDLHLDVDQPLWAAEIQLEQLLPHIPPFYTYQPLSAYPAVHEDLALVVDASRPAADIETALYQAGGALLRRVELFDLYGGAPIPPGKKQLAYHLTFQSDTQTLTDRDTARLRQRMLKQLAATVGATLRE